MHNPKLGSLGRTFICSVVFVDIVEYTKKTVATQLAQRGWFNGMLFEALQGISEEDRIVIDAGDGAAICLLGDPEEAVFIANALRVAIAEHAYPNFALRIGVNLGPVKMAKDINGLPNIIGDGINVAQRVMSFAEPNQILVSRSYFDVVSRISEEYARLFRYDGERKDKHVRAHHVYEILVGGPAEGQAAPPLELGDAQLVSATQVAQQAPAAAALDGAIVEALGLRLTDYLGPIAPLLAKKTARKASSFSALIEMLGDCVPVPAQREQFMREAATNVAQSKGDEPAPVAAPATAAAPGLALGAEALAGAEKLLARHIGPMAALIVKRAAKSARSQREFVETLSASIDGEEERSRFEAEAWGALGRG